MSRASDLAARAARLTERQADETKNPDPVTTPPSSKTPARPARTKVRSTPRAKPVRVTTDLAPQSYRALIAYSGELAETFGRAKVPHVEIIRALVDQLEADPKLRETIASEVKQRLSK